MDAFILFTSLGYMAQTGTLGADLSDPSVAFVIALTILLFIFYCVAIYFSYQGYKEFKALIQEQIGSRDPLGFGGGLGGYGGMGGQSRGPPPGESRSY